MAYISKIKTNNTTYDIKDANAISASEKGANNGVAELDANGKVLTSQLPSYVSDVFEGYLLDNKFYLTSNKTGEITGESNKIYIDKTTGKTYRWSGSTFAVISDTLALGETSATAYRGDRGKTAYDHAAAKGSAYSSGLYKITTNAQGHVTAATAVSKADITAALGYTPPTSDTNTWRGVQNNLTSTATDQSLAAAQGKILNEGKLGAKTANTFVGMTKPDGTDSDWIRTTQNGLIPYQSGGSASGHSSLGTDSWYFQKSYVQKAYNTENHIGNCTMIYDSTNKCLNFNFD